MQILALLGILIADRWVLKFLSIIVDLSIFAVLLVFAPHFDAQLLCRYTLRLLRVFRDSVPLCNYVILFFIFDNLPCSEVCLKLIKLLQHPLISVSIVYFSTFLNF